MPDDAKVAALVAYARERIAECRAVERKFTDAQADADRLTTARIKGMGWVRTDQHPIPQAVVEAWTERQTWQRVLQMMEAKENDHAR